QGVVGDPGLLRPPPRIAEVERAAAAAVPRSCRLVPEEHRQADDRPAGARQQPGGNRGVEAAAHRHRDEPGRSERRRAQRRPAPVSASAPAAIALPVSRRSAATSPASAARNRSTSAAWLAIPKLTRIEDSASAGDSPIASRVWLRSPGPPAEAGAGGGGEA